MYEASPSATVTFPLASGALLFPLLGQAYTKALSDHMFPLKPPIAKHSSLPTLTIQFSAPSMSALLDCPGWKLGTK